MIFVIEYEMWFNLFMVELYVVMDNNNFINSVIMVIIKISLIMIVLLLLIINLLLIFLNKNYFMF